MAQLCTSITPMSDIRWPTIICTLDELFLFHYVLQAVHALPNFICMHTGMPDDDSRLEDVETLMKNVQSSIEQLGKLQQAATVS